MREELEKLNRLQEIDLKIDQAKKLANGAAKTYSPLEKDISDNKKALDLLKAQIQNLQTDSRNLEMEISMDKERISNIDGRLSKVSNNKEFHALTKEAEKAKKGNSDRVKAIEEAKAKIASLSEQLAALETKEAEMVGILENRKKEVGAQVSEADKQIEVFIQDKAGLLNEIQPPLLNRYNRIRNVHKDAVTFARNGRCNSCNVNLPPQLYIQVQKGLEVINCPSCQRIIYFKTDGPTAN